MMKWFRKHNKQLLAVFASALLVVWLGGTALERMLRPNPRRRAIGKAFGEEITGGEHQYLVAKLDLLESLGINWRRPWLNSRILEQLGLPTVQDPIAAAGARPLRDAIDWWLLLKEAERMGVAVSNDEVKRFIAQMGIPPETLARIRDRYGMPTEGLFEAIADYLKVCYAATLASSAVQVTEPEMKDLFVRTNEKVKVRFALLPADAFEKPDEKIPQDELKKLFEECRDYLPGQGKYGFGYRYPDRVRVEYVAADIATVKAAIPKPSDQRARAYWLRHRDRFKPATSPASAPASSPADEFQKVKDRVIDELWHRDAAQAASRAIADLRSRVFDAYIRARDLIKAGKPVPESLLKVMEEETQRISRLRNIPLKFKRTGLLTHEQAQKEPGIATAWVTEANRPLYFADYIFRVRPLFKPAGPYDNRITLDLFQPAVLRDRVGDYERGIYLLRVTEAVPSAPPKSLDEVRDAVERDARILRAYKRAGEVAKKLLAEAQKADLQAAFAKQFPTLATRPATTQPASKGIRLLTPRPFARERSLSGLLFLAFGRPTIPTSIPGIGQSQEFVKTCFELARKTAATQPAGRLAIVELPQRRAWAVVEVLEYIPASQAEFARAKMGLEQTLRFAKLRNFYGRWFNPDLIRQRCGWISLVERQ